LAVVNTALLQGDMAQQTAGAGRLARRQRRGRRPVARPVWTTGIIREIDFALAIIAFPAVHVARAVACRHSLRRDGVPPACPEFRGGRTKSP